MGEGGECLFTRSKARLHVNNCRPSTTKHAVCSFTRGTTVYSESSSRTAMYVKGVGLSNRCKIRIWLIANIIAHGRFGKYVKRTYIVIYSYLIAFRFSFFMHDVCVCVSVQTQKQPVLHTLYKQHMLYAAGAQSKPQAIAAQQRQTVRAFACVFSQFFHPGCTSTLVNRCNTSRTSI